MSRLFFLLTFYLRLILLQKKATVATGIETTTPFAENVNHVKTLTQAKEVFSGISTAVTTVSKITDAMLPTKLEWEGASAAIKKTAGILEKSTKIIGAIASGIQVLGAVMSIISVFLPKPDTPELEAIKKGFQEMRESFKEMHGRFDKLESKVDKVQKGVDKIEGMIIELKAHVNEGNLELQKLINVKFDMAEFTREYKKQREDISGYQKICDDMLTHTDEVGHVARFNTKCGVSFGYELFDAIYRQVFGTFPFKTGIDAVFASVQYDIQTWNAWIQLITADAFQAFLIHQQCLGAKVFTGEVTERYHRIEANASGIKLQAIFVKIAQMQEDLLRDFSAQAIVEIRRYIRLQNNPNANELYDRLKTKYPWAEWVVYVDPIKSEDHHAVCNDRCYNTSIGTRYVFVMWATDIDNKTYMNSETTTTYLEKCCCNSSVTSDCKYYWQSCEKEACPSFRLQMQNSSLSRANQRRAVQFSIRLADLNECCYPDPVSYPSGFTLGPERDPGPEVRRNGDDILSSLKKGTTNAAKGKGLKEIKAAFNPLPTSIFIKPVPLGEPGGPHVQYKYTIAFNDNIAKVQEYFITPALVNGQVKSGSRFCVSVDNLYDCYDKHGYDHIICMCLRTTFLMLVGF